MNKPMNKPEFNEDDHQKKHDCDIWEISLRQNEQKVIIVLPKTISFNDKFLLKNHLDSILKIDEDVARQIDYYDRYEL